jgi:hypothetical protein
VLLARTAPQIARVVATTDRGVEIELRLSEVVEQFGLRFAAAVLPDAHGPGSIRAESDGLCGPFVNGCRPRVCCGGCAPFGAASHRTF